MAIPWSCFWFGCRGHVEHEVDSDGVEWIGLRCVHCGKLKSRSLSNPDAPVAPLSARRISKVEAP